MEQEVSDIYSLHFYFAQIQQQQQQQQLQVEKKNPNKMKKKTDCRRYKNIEMQTK